MNCPLLKKRRGKLEVGHLTAVLRGGNGADDEVTRRAVEGDGEEDHLVGGSGDHRCDRSHDESMAGANGYGWLLGIAGRRKGRASDRRAPLATVEATRGVTSTGLVSQRGSATPCRRSRRIDTPHQTA